MSKMTYKALFILPLLAIAIYADHQKYPGTSTRPVLSDSEASKYTKEAYLQGWSPSSIKTSSADYTVGSGAYSTIQAAVNAAIKAGGSSRKYIKIKKGTYSQAVLIPKTTVPITIYGTPGSPGDVVIKLSQSAQMSGSNYAKQVNPNGAVYKQGDPAWSMFNGCASKSAIGTTCSQVVWAANDNFEIAYLTIENPATDGQAVAARANGDKQNWDHVNFYGFQDTLLSDGKRVYFNKPTIKGDVDFIFGSGSAVFESAQIIGRADRRNTALVFAPNTDNGQKYGFLVINSKITAESGVASNKGCHLARAWDSSSNPNANGQLVIRNTDIENVIKVDAPYEAATSGRPYSGNTNTNRNLDDKNYNRFWEYKNTGGGA